MLKRTISRAVLLAIVLGVSGGVAGAAPVRYSITIYEHKDFEGRSLTYTGAVVNLKATGFNDRVSSIKIVLGQKWLLCKNKKFHGGCIVIDRDVANLESLGFNDTISSFKPVE